jgi:hypothetical protein
LPNFKIYSTEIAAKLLWLKVNVLKSKCPLHYICCYLSLCLLNLLVFFVMFCVVYSSIMLIYNVHNVQRIEIWKSHTTIKFLSLSLFVSEGKVVPVHTTKVYTKSGNIAPPILYLGIRCRWVTAWRLSLFTVGETAEQEVVCVPEAVWRVWRRQEMA